MNYTAIVTTPIGVFELIVDSTAADAADDLRVAGLSILARAPRRTLGVIMSRAPFAEAIRVGEVKRFDGDLSECYPLPHCVGSDNEQWGWMLNRVQ